MRRVKQMLNSGSLPAILVIVVLLVPLALVWLPGGPGDAAPAGDATAPSELPRIAWARLAASLAVAAAAAALAVAIGASLAAAVVLTDLPGRSLWATAALLPFVCPPMVWALGQVYCYGPGGLMERWCGGTWRSMFALSDGGHYVVTTLVLAEIHAPLAMLMIGRGMGRLHHAGLESARLFLPPLGLARWIAAAVRPEAAAAFLLALALGLGNFAVPHVLQCRLYPMEIYARMINYLDHAGAVRMALPLLGLTLIAAACIALCRRRTPEAAAAPAAPRAPIRLGRKAWIVGGLMTLYLALTGLLPLAAMIYECKSPGRFLEAVRAAAPETETTLCLGLAAASVACLAGLVVGVWVSTRRRPAIDVLAIVPIGIPALILALAYLRFYNRTWPLDLAVLGDTSGLVILALAARGWPFVTRAVAAGHGRMAPPWHEAAILGGLTPVRRWRWITGPLLVDYAATGAVVAFILAVGDVEISQMLCVPGGGTLAGRLLTFLHFGPTHVAAGLAVLQLGVAAAPLIVYFLLTNRCLQIV